MNLALQPRLLHGVPTGTSQLKSSSSSVGVGGLGNAWAELFGSTFVEVAKLVKKVSLPFSGVPVCTAGIVVDLAVETCPEVGVSALGLTSVCRPLVHP